MNTVELIIMNCFSGVEKLISEDQTLSCKLSAKMEEFARDQQ